MTHGGTGDAGAPGPEGLRIVCNRDESVTRPAARPPEIRRFEGIRAVMPADPVSDGTWIAASEAGLVMILLNAKPGHGLAGTAPRPASGCETGHDSPRGPARGCASRRGSDPAGSARETAAADGIEGAGSPGDAGAAAPRFSRGTILPRLLPAATLPDALERMRGIDIADFEPFRILITDRRRIAEVRSDGRGLTAKTRGLGGDPLVFASSGLGDALVERPRTALFSELLARGGDLIAIQDEFHAHVWPDRRHLSVLMSRNDARTVSRTTIEITSHDIVLTYDADPHAMRTAPSRVHLSLRAGAPA